jgi:uncharacterized phage protein gp47/JayE
MTLDELTTPATVDEVKASIYAAIAALGVDTTVWKPGAPTRTMIAALAIVLAALSTLQSLIARMGFLALAEGEWLTQKAFFDFDVERDEGSFATGEVELDNAGGGVHSGDPGDLIFVNTNSGKTYRNTEAFSIAAFETDVVVPIQAIEIGSASNAAPNEIDDFETPLLGVTVTNPASVIGRDEESDPELQARCSAKTGTLSPNGPRDAYTFVALSAVRLDGTSVGVTRVRSIADGDGNVTVYVASASGAITGTSGDPETDLGAVHDAIQTQAVPLAVTETTVAATNKLILITYEIWLRDTLGQTEALVEEAIEDALDDFVSTYPIGGFVIPPASGKVYLSAIETVIGSVFPEHTVKLEVTIPAGDTDLLINEVPVPSTITCLAVNFVSGGVI